MNGAQTNQVEAILKPLATDSAVKSAAWKAYFSAQTPQEFRRGFDALPLPQAAKAALWDLRFGALAVPAPAKPGRPTAVGPPAVIPPTQIPSPGLTLPPLPNLQAPMVDVAGMVPETRPGAPTGEQFTMGLTRGAARGAGALTSPENVGLMGAMHLAPSILGRAGAFIAGGAGLFFTFEMAKALVESAPEALQAYKERDWGKLGEIIGQDAVTALLLGHGGKEARRRAGEVRLPGVPRTKPIEAVPETKAAQARARAEKPPGPPTPPMSRQQRRALSEVPGTARTPEEGAALPESAETANLRRIAARLGLDYDTMTPADRTALIGIQHEMNLAALGNISTPPPTWWPPPVGAGARPALPPLPAPEAPPATREPLPKVITGEEPALQPRPEAPKAEVRPPEVAPPPAREEQANMFGELVQPKASEAGEVKYLPTAEITADPARFQFKTRGIGEKGVGEELKAVTVWNPDLAGVIAVWRNPADGKVYVVNGHHRLELAQRLGVPEVPVRFIQAADVIEARGKGALINIAEGRGDAIDAAKVFRDLGIGPPQLEKVGVSLRGPVAKDAIALGALPSDIFEQVSSGEVSMRRGAILGEMLPGRFEDQRAVLQVIERAENRGRRPTDDQIREMIRLQVGASKGRTEVQQTLFGPEEIQRAAILERAQVSDYVRKELQQDKRLFGAVSEAKGARKLGEAGNVIRAEENARIARATAQAMEVYDRLSASAGPINDILTRAANELAEGREPDAAKRQAYREIRAAIAELIPGTRRPGQGSEGAPGIAAVALGRGGEAVPEGTVPVPRGTAGQGAVLERIERIQGPEFDPLGSLSQHAAVAEARQGDVQGYPVVYVNAQGMALLCWAGYRGYNPGNTGQTMPRSVGIDTMEHLSDLVEMQSPTSVQYERLYGIVETLRQATSHPEGRPLVVIDTSPRLSEGQIRETVAEEIGHATQIESTGAEFKDHVGPSFWDAPLARAAAAYLRAEGYTGYAGYSDAALSLEVGVRLMLPGRYQELGLTAEQGAELAAQYCDALEARHGSQAVARVVNRVYDAFQEAIRGVRQAARGVRRQEGAGPSPQAATGEAQAGQPGRPARLAQVERGTPVGKPEAEPPSGSLFGPGTEGQASADQRAYEAKLEADRLTAQFRAPITREEQLKRLKRAKPKEQPGLFGGPPPEPQGSLFRLLRLPPVPGRS